MADEDRQHATKFRIPEPGGHEIAPRGPVAPTPERVGGLLQRTREKHERSIADVAAELNIRAAYLEALEQGRFDKLPGKAYAIGFLRSYAEFLDLDSKDLVRRFKDEITGLEQCSELVFPTPVPESRVPGGALILVSLILCIVAYGAWSVLSRDSDRLAELVPAVPDRLQELVTRADPSGERPEPLMPAPQSTADFTVTLPSTAEADALSIVEAAPQPSSTAPLDDQVTAVAVEPAGGLQGASPQTAETPLQSVPEQPLVPVPATRPLLDDLLPPQVELLQRVTDETIAADEQPLPPAAASQAVIQDAPESLADPAAPVTAAVSQAQPSLAEIPAAPDTTQLATLPEPSAPRVYGLSNVGSRVTLLAKQDSWIQVREGPEELLISRVLQAGDSYRVPDRPGILLQTGNAGGLDVEVDGRNLGTFGAVGAVRRDVPLDPERLFDGSAFRR